MIKIYGSPRSSAGRCYLILEELGLPYETLPLDMANKEHKKPAYLKLNPNGKVPCLVDEEFVIWESLAINYYLVDKYKPELLGAQAKERGHVQQWSVWALTELQPPLVEILIQMMFVPEPHRDMARVQKAREKVPPMLQILNEALAHKKFLVGERLTLADFNVGSVINLAVGLQMDMRDYPNIQVWFGQLKERPSFKKFSDVRSK